MTKVEMRKHILAAIAPICEEHQYQRMPKRLAFYKIRDGVLSFVLFDNRVAGFVSGIYVMPLYIPNENLILDYGNQIWRMNIRNAKHYDLDCDMPDEEILQHLENIKYYLQETGFPLLERFGTPQGVIESISRKKHPVDFFFTDAKHLHVAATFPYFHAKKGTKLLQKAALHPAGHCLWQCARSRAAGA